MTRRAIVQKWILYCLCALVLLASLLLSAEWGTEWGLYASPFLLIPLGIFLLLSGRM